MATSASCSSTESALMTKTLQGSRRRFRAPIGFRVSMPRKLKLFTRIRASLVDSSDFVSRMEKTCNHGQLFVRLATQRGILNANGVEVLVSSLLVTKCSVKFHRKIPAVLFAMARDPCVVLIVKEPAFAQSGWKNLQLQSSKDTMDNYDAKDWT
ncbi:hypothetical protein AHAS_Ahas16G0306100 [Arachis hypogaea]